MEQINEYIKPLFNYNTEIDAIDDEIGELLDRELTME